LSRIAFKTTKAVRYCSEKLSISFSVISSWTDYRYRLLIFWEPPIIFRYGNNLPIIFYIERHSLNINCNRYIQTKLCAMSSKPVVIKLYCDSKETQTNHVRSKLSDILKVYKENMFPEKYRDNQNIRPFKYRFRLSIFQINYSIDDTDYRLWHGLTNNTCRMSQENDPMDTKH
jgi:hypothetical protein